GAGEWCTSFYGILICLILFSEHEIIFSQLKVMKNKQNKSQKGFNSITSQDTFNKEMKAFPHTLPIYTTSTFIYESPEIAQQIFGRQIEGFAYSRFSHPNAQLVEEKLEK